MYLPIIVLSVLLGTAKCLDDVESFYKYLRDDGNTSNAECDLQKAALLQGLINGDAWASKMVDAYGRVQGGRTQGNIMNFGMFDQCLAISKELNTTTIKGKYCFPGLVVISLTNSNLNTSQLDESIKRRIARSGQPSDDDDEIATSGFFLLAACVPDACNPSDLFGSFGVDSSCQTKGETKQLDASDIAFIAFISVIACLIIASTSYDVYLKKSSKETNHPILLAFSFYTNGKNLFKTTKQADQILCFNGIKVLSMFWVILGHRYSNYEIFIVNGQEAATLRKQWYSVYLVVAPLAVDTFLFISGTLLSYIFLKTMRKPNQKFNIGMYYLHRYLRLTPALAVLYFFMVTLARRVTDGPMQQRLASHYRDSCLDENWWAFFLYVQNYVAIDNMCLLHTWYLSVDMQFYILSPLLLLPMFYFGKRITYIVLPILVLAAVASTMWVFYYYDIALWSDDYHNKFYYVTHTRFSPWLIGLIFGAFLIDYQANKSRYQIKNKLILLALWVAVLCVMGFIFFYQNDADFNHTRIKSTFFFPLQRPLWALCLCWMSFACLTGNGGFLNSFLSSSFFQVLSKVTYSTYLIHQPLITFTIEHMRAIPIFTNSDAIRAVLADICICCVVGGLWTLAFEYPFIVLEKVIFGRGNGKKKIEEPKDCNDNPKPSCPTEELTRKD